MENTTTRQVQTLLFGFLISSHFSVDVRVTIIFIFFVDAGAVLVFLPGLAEIKMLYEQLMSNRLFNNRGKSRSVSGPVSVVVVLVFVAKQQNWALQLFTVLQIIKLLKSNLKSFLKLRTLKHLFSEQTNMATLAVLTFEIDLEKCI